MKVPGSFFSFILFIAHLLAPLYSVTAQENTALDSANHKILAPLLNTHLQAAHNSNPTKVKDEIKNLTQKMKTLLSATHATTEEKTKKLSRIAFINDLEDYLKIVDDLQHNEPKRKEILDYLSININNNKIPFNDMHQVPVYHDSFMFDGELTLAALIASCMKSPVPKWLRTLLEKVPSLHFRYNCKYHESDLDEGKHTVGELIHKQEALHPLFRGGLLNFLRFLWSHKISISPNWSEIVIHLPDLKNGE